MHITSLKMSEMEIAEKTRMWKQSNQSGKL
jgi:hypothetical protein